jgi:uncharacterized protein
MRPSLALKANADRVITIFSRFDVRNPRIFGSTARAEDGDQSDLDILVDAGEELTFFDLARLERELSAVLGCRVEVTTPGGLSAEATETVARDMKAFP